MPSSITIPCPLSKSVLCHSRNPYSAHFDYRQVKEAEEEGKLAEINNGGLHKQERTSKPGHLGKVRYRRSKSVQQPNAQ